MNKLIKINYENDKPTVNGRELHKALQIKTNYKDWFSRMLEYGFVDGKDFSSFLSESTGGRPSTNHEISISMAKQLCMIQRTEIGRKFREYFIKIEEAWNSPEKVMERALQIAHQRVVEVEKRLFDKTKENEILKEENETLEIALNQSLQYYTVAKYNKEFQKKWDMKQSRKIGKEMVCYCRSHAIEIKKCKINDERFGEVNSYPMIAWNGYFKEKLDMED